MLLVDNCPLDPQVKAFYGHRLDSVPLSYPSVDQMRRDADSVFNDQEKRVEIFSTEDRFLPYPGHPLPVRIYTPFSPKIINGDGFCLSDGHPLPVMVYFHGGGFIMHNIPSHDSLCRKLSAECSCLVVSVGYRLAPEFKYPSCIEDGYFALEWVYRNAASFGGDPGKIILAGDSAGASISSALSLLSRDHKGPKISLQVLCYGSAGCIPDRSSPSVKLFGYGGYVLPKKMIDLCMDLYLPSEGLPENDCYLYPGQAKDLSNLPPTLSITAAYDPLRDDGEAFAHLLSQWGNEVVQYRMPGMMHGFLLYWYRFDRAEEAIGHIAEEVRRLLHCAPCKALHEEPI